MGLHKSNLQTICLLASEIRDDAQLGPVLGVLGKLPQPITVMASPRITSRECHSNLQRLVSGVALFKDEDLAPVVEALQAIDPVTVTALPVEDVEEGPHPLPSRPRLLECPHCGFQGALSHCPNDSEILLTPGELKIYQDEVKKTSR